MQSEEAEKDDEMIDHRLAKRKMRCSLKKGSQRSTEAVHRREPGEEEDQEVALYGDVNEGNI